MAFVDVGFPLTGEQLPVDHGYHLFAAISRVLPALHGDQEVGVHPIQGRMCGNRMLQLTRDSRLTIRLHADRIADVLPLAGATLHVAGNKITLAAPSTAPLLPRPRLYSRLVVIKGFTEPEGFLAAANRQLTQMGVKIAATLVPLPTQRNPRQSRQGSRSPFIRRTLRVRNREIVGFAARVEGLMPEEALALQERGLGGRRRFGCGVFMPEER